MRIIEGVDWIIASSRGNFHRSREWRLILVGVGEDHAIRANILFLAEGIIDVAWRVDQIFGRIAHVFSHPSIGTNSFSFFEQRKGWISSALDLHACPSPFRFLQILLQSKVILLCILLVGVNQTEDNSIRLPRSNFTKEDLQLTFPINSGHIEKRMISVVPIGEGVGVILRCSPVEWKLALLFVPNADQLVSAIDAMDKYQQFLHICQFLFITHKLTVLLECLQIFLHLLINDMIQLIIKQMEFIEQAIAQATLCTIHFYMIRWRAGSC